MHTRLALVGLGLLAALGSAPQERVPGVKRLVFVLEVDHDRARETGWSGATREEVLEFAAKIVERRFVAMERAARVEVWRDAQRIEVSLPSIDPRDRELFEEMLRSIGVCELFFIADEAVLSALGIDLDTERKRLETWRQANPSRSIEAFHALYPEQQGPPSRLLWAETLFDGRSGPPVCLLLPDRPEDALGAASFETCSLALDPFGYPAIAFDVRESRKEDLARFTEAHRGQRLGIVLAGKVRSAPTLKTKLVGGGLIEGRFGQEECERIAAALTKREGPLRVVEIR